MNENYIYIAKETIDETEATNWMGYDSSLLTGISD